MERAGKTAQWHCAHKTPCAAVWYNHGFCHDVPDLSTATPEPAAGAQRVAPTLVDPAAPLGASSDAPRSACPSGPAALGPADRPHDARPRSPVDDADSPGSASRAEPAADIASANAVVVPAAPPIGASSFQPVEAHPPPGVASEGRCWLGDLGPTSRRPGEAHGSCGCASHAGPRSVAEEKGNEDFAFAIRVIVHDDEWFLVGVADGVTNSTWAERGAVHAVATYIEVVTAILEQERRPEEQMQLASFRATRLNRPFVERFRARIDDDERDIVERGRIHPMWEEKSYTRTYLSGPTAAERRKDWFQTTLLAVALGPRGGFALFLGDGFARVDRVDGQGRRESKVVSTQRRSTDDDRAPDIQLSRWLTTADVDGGFRGILPQGAVRLSVVLSTDGVSKSPAHGLEDVALADSRDCRAFLEQLAERPAGRVEPDNMSVAFVTRTVCS